MNFDRFHRSRVSGIKLLTAKPSPREGLSSQSPASPAYWNDVQKSVSLRW